MPFTMEVAGICVRVSPLHEDIRVLCGDYLCEGVPALHVAVSQVDIDAERAAALPGRWSDGYLETLAVYRRIAEWLPAHDRLLVHGAAVAFKGRAFLFCAPSGTGKSTHVRLWREHLGGAVTVINGDKPIVEVPPAACDAPRGAAGAASAGAGGSGSAWRAAANGPLAGSPAVVYGTPWAGKEGWQMNASAPLAGICFLGRAEPGASSIRRVQPAECLDAALAQVYLLSDAQAVGLTLELLDALLSRTPLFQLACDVSQDAVRCSFQALTGLEFDKFRSARGRAEAPGGARAE